MMSCIQEMTSVPSKYSLIKISSYDTITPSSPTHTSNRTDKEEEQIVQWPKEKGQTMIYADN
jgi:hypothetical protein